MPYATPKWVEEAGAKGHHYVPGKGIDPGGGTHWEPDYDDPIFLEKLDHFLAAAGARYDGRPEVAFIDVGTFGVWGEGHTFHTTKLGYTAETVIRHIDLHRKHFPRTLLRRQRRLRQPGPRPGVDRVCRRPRPDAPG
ncbi:MAG: hypothetical protein M5U09_04640 [Gammaproteobacteria bacterium]|nr:hypothetical protein [Gammaproteobacteria bacterium]